LVSHFFLFFILACVFFVTAMEGRSIAGSDGMPPKNWGSAEQRSSVKYRQKKNQNNRTLEDLGWEQAAR
jgi:hypothetical protein